MWQSLSIYRTFSHALIVKFSIIYDHAEIKGCQGKQLAKSIQAKSYFYALTVFLISLMD